MGLSKNRVQFPLDRLGCQFNFNTNTILFQTRYNLLNRQTTKQLTTRFYIRKSKSRYMVAKPGDKTIDGHMPGRRICSLLDLKPRAEHDV